MSHYINIPLVGEFFVERTINPKGRTYIDGAKNKGGIELFIGRTHLIIDKPQIGGPVHALFGVTLFSLLFASDTASAHIQIVTDHVHAGVRYINCLLFHHEPSAL